MFFPFHRGIMWPSLFTVTINRIFDNGRFCMITLVLYIGSLPNLTTWFSCGRGRTLFILGSLGQRSLTINIIFDRPWPNDPKINRVLPLSQGNHVVKFVKDPIYRTKVIVRKRPCCQKIIFIASDLDLWPNDPICRHRFVISVWYSLYLSTDLWFQCDILLICRHRFVISVWYAIYLST
jgi:hypothetical protein